MAPPALPCWLPGQGSRAQNGAVDDPCLPCIGGRVRAPCHSQAVTPHGDGNSPWKALESITHQESGNMYSRDVNPTHPQVWQVYHWLEAWLSAYSALASLVTLRCPMSSPYLQLFTVPRELQLGLPVAGSSAFGPGAQVYSVLHPGFSTVQGQHQTPTRSQTLPQCGHSQGQIRSSREVRAWRDDGRGPGWGRRP